VSFELIHWIILPIVFVSMTTRATLGFGEALIAMPLLTMLVGLELAAPLVSVNSIIISAAILLLDRKRLHFQSAWRLLVGGTLGIPLGLLMLGGDGQAGLQIALGVLIVGFSAFKLARPHLFELKTDRSAYIFGFLSGVLGGMFNTGGPPLVIYGSARRFEPEEFRVTLQSFFLPAGIMVAVGHGIAGRLTGEVWSNVAATFPVVVVALLLGTLLNRKLPKGRFDMIAYGLLVIVGLGLIIKTIAVG